jgi:hypothetical protein
MEARAWVTYKFAAATWYTKTLEQLIDIAGFQRFVGIEMSLDGALISLNGAFDASVAGLISASERFLNKENPEFVLTPAHRFDERLFAKQMNLLHQQNLRFDVLGTASAVASALQREDANNITPGWLQQFRRLRNTPTHQNTAPRHIDVVVGSDAITSIAVAGHGQDPVAYLRTTQERISALTEPILELVDYILPNGVPSLVPLRTPGEQEA